MNDETLLEWLWLANGLGIAAANAGEVMRLFETPAALRAALGQEDVSMLLTKTQHATLTATTPAQFVPTLQRCRELSVSLAVYMDEDYPAKLRNIPDAPVVLYYRGSLSAAAAPLAIGVIGTRKPSAYGVQATQLLAKGLAEAGVVLISGLATGLDSEAHKASLAAEMPTIACIAFGHDKCYPSAHKKLKECIEHTGLVLSEFAPGTEPLRPYFLYRNRLIAGLSNGICVAEARRASGTMNTVANALSYNRDVFAVPGSIFSPLSDGTNHLLQEGAVPVTQAGDILHYYHMEKQPQAPKDAHLPPEVEVSAGAAKLRTFLNYTPRTLQQLTQASGMSAAEAMAALTELELAGLAQQQAGRRFIIME